MTGGIEDDRRNRMTGGGIEDDRRNRKTGGTE
jgi:hypothetical protein